MRDRPRQQPEGRPNSSEYHSGCNTGLVHAGGYLGLVAAALAAYLSCAELCQASYKREVLPIWPLAKS